MMWEVAKYNTDPDLIAFYLDPINRVALAGYRRIYGIGDCLVRVTAPELEIGTWPNHPFVWSYNGPCLMPDVYGLKGERDPNANDRFEQVGTEQANRCFEEVFNQVIGPDTFGVMINPKMVCDFIESRVRNKMQNHKINIHVFNGVSTWGGHPMVPGKVVTGPNNVPVVPLRRPNNQIDYAYIDDQKSLIPISRLREGQMYVIQGVAVVDGVTTVRILREFKRGVRMAIQYFKDGLLMPNDARYTVLPDPDAEINEKDIEDFPFIEGQQTAGFEHAPMLHFDVDTLYRALKPMTSFPVAEMRFRNSITGVLISTLAPGMRIDAIIGPTSPYKSGKVYTE